MIHRWATYSNCWRKTEEGVYAMGNQACRWIIDSRIFIMEHAWKHDTITEWLCMYMRCMYVAVGCRESTVHTRFITWYWSYGDNRHFAWLLRYKEYYFEAHQANNYFEIIHTTYTTCTMNNLWFIYTQLVSIRCLHASLCVSHSYPTRVRWLSNSTSHRYKIGSVSIHRMVAQVVMIRRRLSVLGAQQSPH